MPSYQSIQSVLNFMWGKGHKLDIRTNLKERTIMVRIPNEYIRTKVLEKKIWYVAPPCSMSLPDCLTAPPELPSKTPPLAKLPQKPPPNISPNIEPAAPKSPTHKSTTTPKSPAHKSTPTPTSDHPPASVTASQRIEGENLQKNFESDLQEIMDEDLTPITLPTINPPPSHKTATLPLKTLSLPSFSQPSPVSDCVTFTNLPLEAPFIIGLQALPHINRRITPFKHRPSFKKQLPRQKLSLKNSFATLDLSEPSSPTSDSSTPPANNPESFFVPPNSLTNQDPPFVPPPTLPSVPTEEPLLHNGVAPQPSL
ncbi:extensin-like [Brassica rapa]|uniref:extensin-like n=1 Tax=Brassica campestris TaxID=3711 RepID=UPI00142D43D9|nr:extensin-like [Brassica rapa]